MSLRNEFLRRVRGFAGLVSFRILRFRVYWLFGLSSGVSGFGGALRGFRLALGCSLLIEGSGFSTIRPDFEFLNP